MSAIMMDGTAGGGGGGSQTNSSQIMANDYELETSVVGQQQQQQQQIVVSSAPPSHSDLMSSSQISQVEGVAPGSQVIEDGTILSDVLSQQQHPAHQLEEGIIYRNVLPNSNKVQMIGTTGPNQQQNRVFFLNSSSGAAVTQMGNVKTTSYINMVKPCGTVATSSGKIMNLMTGQQKNHSQQGIVPKVPKSVQVLKRLPQQGQGNVQPQMTIANLVSRQLVQQKIPGQSMPNSVQQAKGLVLTQGSVSTGKVVTATKMGIIQQQPMTMKMFTGAGQKIQNNSIPAIATSGVLRTTTAAQYKNQLQPGLVTTQTTNVGNQQKVKGVTKFGVNSQSGKQNSFKPGSPGNRPIGYNLNSNPGQQGVVEINQEAILHHQKVVNPIQPKPPGKFHTPHTVQQMLNNSSYGIQTPPLAQQQQPKFVSPGSTGNFIPAQHQQQSPNNPNPIQYQPTVVQQALPGQLQQQQQSQQSYNIIQPGAIKYVNAQGNVIPGPRCNNNNKSATVLYNNSGGGGGGPGGGTSSPPDLIQTPQTLEMTNVIQYSSSSSSGNAGAVNATGGNVVNKKKGVTTSAATQPLSGPMDDVYYVNGPQMNEEMVSARILQSLSQKSTQRYITQQQSPQQQQTMLPNQQQPQHHQQPQSPVKYHYVMQSFDAQQSSTGGGYQIPPNVQGIIAKHGPEYFRVK